jgi:Mrp family chromosome partitioning ATPase
VSDPKRTSRFGEPLPGRGAPLPMVTQPMVAMTDDAAGATRVDNPMLGTEPISGARMIEAATVANPHMVAFTRQTAMSAPLAKPAMPAGPPPEIGLQQHHLPPEEALDSRLEMILDPDSERSASFRVLRHHLLELGRPQVIVVSSPLHGDGKTTTALNLALALAECGRAKVLLCDGHLRRPQIANALKLVPPWCFAEQLAAHRNQPMLPWSLVEIPQLWLHVAAVSPRIEKTQLLDAPAFAIAMERLRLAYEHIVIDAPPVLGSADVNLMSDAADAVLLAVRARRSTARELRKSIEQVGASKVVGSVLVQ